MALGDIKGPAGVSHRLIAEGEAQGRRRGGEAQSCGAVFVPRSGSVRQTCAVVSRRWIREHWPSEADPDERFEGYNGAVAEMRSAGERAGYAMMEVQEWATIEGHLWWKRLTGVQTLPALHLAYWDQETAEQRDYAWPVWFTHDAAGADAMYEECIASCSLTWDDVIYDLTWLDEPEAARVRAELFWEPEPR